ncbi:MAG: ABC transporter ATP-binding protein, partial [Saccharothrix sp.]|nr:ABC transporter ATP-binding protein [Saccharothrix sp.]
GLLPAVIALVSGWLVALLGPAGSDLVLPVVVLLGVVFLLSQLSGPLARLVADVVGRRLGADLQRRLITALARPVGVGPLLAREVRADVGRARAVVTGPVDARDTLVAWTTVAVAKAQALSCVLVLLWFRPLPALLLAAAYFGFAAVLTTEYRDRQLAAYGADESRRRADYLRDLALTGAAAKDVRVFGLRRWLIDHHARSWPDQRVRRRSFAATSALVVTAVAVAAAHAFVLIQLGSEVVAGRMSPGALTVFTSAVAGVSGAVVLTMEVIHLHRGRAAVRAAVSAERRLDRSAAESGVAGPSGWRTIRFEGVGFRYPGADAWVLRYLDLTVESGRSLAVVGVNGAGKSSLLKLLLRLHHPAEGRITVDGVDLAGLDPMWWRDQVSAVFQSPNRYPATLADNIAYGAPRRPAGRADLDRAAHLAGLTDLVAALPRGYDTVLSTRYPGGVDLSGGQWQRVALARAVRAVDAGARLLALDEPTAALDVRAEAAFNDRVMALPGPVTTVLVSHRFAAVRRADRIVVLDGGRVVEDGDHEALMSVGGTYAGMFAAQSERFGVR